MPPGKKTENNPELAQQLLQELSTAGATLKKVSRKTGVTFETIRQFYLRNQQVIETNRSTKWADLAPKLMELSDIAIDQAKATMWMADPKDAMIAAGIAIEKGHLIEGKATQIVSQVHEHRHTVTGVLDAIREALETRQSTPQLTDGTEAGDR